MAGVFRGRKAEEGLGERGSGTDPWRCSVPSRGSWGSQGTIIFAPTTSERLEQVPDAGGAPQPLTRLEKGETSHGWPEFLPGGKAVLFAAGADNAVGATRRLPSSRSGRANDGTWSQGRRNPATRPPDTWFMRKGET